MSKFIALILWIIVIFDERKTARSDIFEEGCYRDGLSDVCWLVKDYPAEDIQLKLNKYDSGYLSTHLGDHHKYSPINVTEPTELPCTLCKTSLSFYVRPLKLTEGDDSCYVVNTENYQQTIQFNFCSGNVAEETLCATMPKDLPLNHRGRCQQKKTILRLLCYNPRKLDFEVWKLHYPSSCVCVITKTEDVGL